MVLKTKTLFRFLLFAALALLLGWLIFGSPLLVHADAILTIEPITWNVVGLDSNNVNVGPNTFPVGVRVCNSGDDPATNVSADFVWDSSDAYVDIRAGSLNPITTSTLAAGTCSDFYFEIEIPRDANAYDHTREYHIEVSSTETSAISTSTPREIYVEHLISQSRNSTTDVKLDNVSIAPGGTMTLMLGETYNIELVGSTATNGYEQIESYINFPNTIFQINSVTSTYTANGGTDPDAATKVYADGCSWENDPNSPNYRSCLSTGKYGGDITVTYNVEIIGGAGTSETLNTLIYDFSGSSYHYNSDFSVAGRIAAIVDPSLVTIDKNFAPDPTSVTGTSTLTFTLSNPNDVAISGASFTDTFPNIGAGAPGDMVVASPATYSTNSCGTPTFAPTAGAGSISFSDGTIPANGSCTVSVQVSTTAIGTYDNTSSNLLIGTTDTGNSASDSLVVNDDLLPPPCTPGLELATWTFPGTTTDYTFKSSQVSTATESINGVISSGVDANYFPAGSGNAWFGQGNWPSVIGSFPGTPTGPYFEFILDTSQFTGVSIALDYELEGNWANAGDNHVYIYSSANGGAFTNLSDLTPVSRRTWYSRSDTAASTGSSTTTFRIYAVGAQRDTAILYIDNIIFTGCGVPQYPSIVKTFSPDPIAVNDTSTLTFTITNENNVSLTGLEFTDALPSGVEVAATPAASTTCGGGPTWAPAAGETNLVFGNPTGGTVPGRVGTTNGSCTVQVDVTATTAGPHTNVSGFISSTETGPNTGPDGSATDTLTAISPPSISKQFAPNPILVNGISTLTFTIANPNPDNQLTNVAFTDNYPSVNLVNSTPANASTTCTGGTVTAVDGGGSISLSGATIAGGSTCTVQVDVTSAVDASYANTSGNVSADIVGNGNTASDTLVVEPVRPAISLLKQVSATGAAPWTTFVAVDVGDSVWYQFTVENTGDVALTTVSVTDPTLSGLGVDLSGCSWATLALYETQTCQVGPVIAVSGSNSNTATAHGIYNLTEYTDTSTATYGTTGLTLVKTATQTTYQTAGDVLDYSYFVSNTGFAPLLGPVTIDDDRATDESCPAVETVGDNDAYLDPGESITCTATYTILPADVTAQSVTNTADATVDGVTSNTDSETVTYLAPPTVTKVFLTTPITAGQTSTLIITLNNPGGTDLTGVAFTDTYPAAIENANPTNASTTCTNGTVTAVAGGGTVGLSGATISANTACNVRVDVTSYIPGAHTNTIPIGVVTTDQSVSNNAAATDTLTVNFAAPTVTKTFIPDLIIIGGTSTLTIEIDNPNAAGLTGVAFTDNLPAGVSVASTPNAATTGCGTPTWAPGAGDTALGFSGGSIAASGTCTVEVDVTSSTPGTVTNTTSVVTSTEAPDSGTASDDLTVVNPELTLVKTITSGDPYSSVGDVLSYSFAVTNSGNVTLDGPFTVADDRATDESCPVTATLAPGASITCTASYVVTQADIDNGSVTNTATASGSFAGNPVTSGPDSEAATATQSPSLNVTKSETSTGPYGVGDTITYDIDVLNTGNVTLTGVTVTDPDTTVGVCAPVQPGSLAPSATMTCPASYVVTQADVDAGSFTNTATGDSNETGPDTGSEVVTFTQSPGITMLKEVSVDGGSSWQDADSPPGPSLASGTDPQFRFTVTNSGNVTLSNMGLSDTDMSSFFESDLSTGCAIPGTLAPGGSFVCYGTLTWASGQHTDTATGSGDFSASTYSDTDDANYFGGSPALTLAKSETSTGPYNSVGDVIDYELVATNSGNVGLTNVTISDPTVGALTCVPVQPAALAVGASMTCTGSYTITQADLDSGSVTNTGTADSDETGPETDSVTVVLTQSPSLNVTKTESSTGPYGVGDTITYDIDVLNTGNVTLTGVTVTDPDTTVGVCSPVQPASLAPGATMTCPASYVVTQADVDAGSFTNTATGDSNETGPDTGYETVTFTQSPSLNVTKSETSTGPYGVGDTITYDIDVLNTGNMTLTSVTVTDPDTTVGVCAPVQPGSLAPGATMTCPASYVVTQADVDAGSFTNTATGDSNDTGPDTGSETVTFTQSPGITMLKEVSVDGGSIWQDANSPPGQSLASGTDPEFRFTVTNSGNVTLGSMGLSDTDMSSFFESDMTMPCAIPGTLAPGGSFVCYGTLMWVSGQHTDTATGSGDFGASTYSDTDDANYFGGSASLNVTKTETSTGPYSVGDTITYDIDVLNTGNVTLTGVTVTDPDTTVGVCAPVQPGSLAPGATMTCPASYVVTQADVDAGSFTNTATGDSNETGPDTGSETITFTQSPSLNVTKTETSTGLYGVGDTITYDIDVLNTGNVTLTSVTVTDPDTTVGVCAPVQPGSLAPGATMTCPASYVVTQADVDAGSFTNTATGDSNETGPDTGSETITFTQSPSLNVTKSETSTGPYSVGDTITYDIEVDNTGNVTLTGVTVTDPDTTVGVCAPAQPGSLAPGATMTCPASYVVTQADVDAGSFTNTATGDSNETGPDTGSETVTFTQSPALTLVKTITSGNPYSSVGDVLSYSFAVTNSGNVTLDGPFTVADDRAADESCPPTATLAPGASITCTASYTVTQTDIDNGSVTNTATASGSFAGNPVNSAPDSETANAAVPIVIDPGVTKSGDPLTAKVGDTVTFTLFVFNTGNADADNVIVTDVIPAFLDIIPPVVISPLGPAVTIAGNTITMDFDTVEPSESWTVTITTVVNALGVPSGDSNDVTLVTTSDDADLDNNDDSVFITISGDGPLLPGTGFAPNRVTALPQMPADYAYLSYGELRLEIPELDVDTSIVGVPRDGDGWDVTWLWNKAGYLSGTAFPTWSGNSVITGHVVLANGLEGPFADLKELEYGDVVIVHGWGEQYVYEIREVEFVSPYDPSVLRHEEYPWLTLVTCAGFDEMSDSYHWRVVARAVMMSIDSEAGSWTSSSSQEQHDIQAFDRVGSGGVQP